MPRNPLDLGSIIGNDEEPIRLESTLGETAEAATALSFQEGPTMAFARMWSLSSLDDVGEKLDPKELNQKFPHLDRSFTEPMTLASAIEIERRQKERHRLEGVVGRGADQVGGGTTAFVSGLWGQVLDPANWVEGALTAGVFTGIRALRHGAKAAEIASKTGRMARLGQDAMEGAIGASFGESLTYAAAQYEQQEYTAGMAFTNVAAGALLMPGVKYGLGAISDQVLKFSSKRAEQIHTQSVNSSSRDQITQVGKIYEFNAREMGGEGPLPYEHHPFMGNVDDRTWYTSTDGDELDLSMGSHSYDELGQRGITVTSNGNKANNWAAPFDSDAPGSVHEIIFTQDTRILDLDLKMDKPVAPVERQRLIGALSNAGLLPLKLRKKLKNVSTEQLLERVQKAQEEGKIPADAKLAPGVEEAGYPEKTLLLRFLTEYGDFHPEKRNHLHLLTGPELAEELRTTLTKGQTELMEWERAVEEAGYHGYHYTESSVHGRKVPPSNVMRVFDPNRVEHVVSSKGDPELSVRPSQAEIDALAKAQLDPKNHIAYDETWDLTEFNKDINGDHHADLNRQLQELDSETDDFLEMVKDLEESDFFDADELLEIAEIKRQDQILATKDDFARKATACMRGA